MDGIVNEASPAESTFTENVPAVIRYPFSTWSGEYTNPGSVSVRLKYA